MGFADEAFDELSKAAMRGRNTMLEDMQKVNRGEPFVMRFLSQNGTATPSQLARALNSSTGRISALLAQLEKKGYIVREVDPSNRRNVLVSITDDGRAETRRRRDEMHRDVRVVFERMGEEHTRQLVELVKEFAGYMRQAQEERFASERRPGSAEPAECPSQAGNDSTDGER